jgi:hypothetical protein
LCLHRFLLLLLLLFFVSFFLPPKVSDTFLSDYWTEINENSQVC